MNGFYGSEQNIPRDSIAFGFADLNRNLVNIDKKMYVIIKKLEEISNKLTIPYEEDKQDDSSAVRS